MKYFKNELWEKINSENEEDRISAEIQWGKNSDEYNRYYNKIKRCFPKKFISIYENENGFHDYTIFNINIKINYSTKSSIEISLLHKKTMLIINYLDVKSYNLNAKDLNNTYFTWAYDELEFNNDKTFIHRILCSNNNYIEIMFGDININKVTDFC